MHNVLYSMICIILIFKQYVNCVFHCNFSVCAICLILCSRFIPDSETILINGPRICICIFFQLISFVFLYYLMAQSFPKELCSLAVLESITLLLECTSFQLFSKKVIYIKVLWTSDEILTKEMKSIDKENVDHILLMF